MQKGEVAYHGLDVWVRHRVELLELQLVVGSYVDVGAPILGGIAVFGRREDCNSSVSHAKFGATQQRRPSTYP